MQQDRQSPGPRVASFVGSRPSEFSDGACDRSDLVQRIIDSISDLPASVSVRYKDGETIVDISLAEKLVTVSWDRLLLPITVSEGDEWTATISSDNAVNDILARLSSTNSR